MTSALMNGHTTSEQMAALNAKGLEKRIGKGQLKRRVKAGEVTFDALVTDPLVEDLMLFDLALWLPKMGRWRLEQLGRNAVRAGVNLAVPVGRCSERSRRWLVWAVGELMP